MGHRTQRRGQRGQGAVEGVLVLLVFLAILIGALDLGQVLFIHQSLADRARSAVRYAVVHTYDASAVRNMVLYNQATVPDGRTSGTFGLTDDMVTVSRENTGSTEERIVVAIHDYPYRFYSPWISGAVTGKPIIASQSYEAP